MKAFKVEFEMRTAIVLSAYPMSLDGLLYYGISKVHNNDDPLQVRSILDKVIERTDGVYKASEMIWLRSYSKGLTSQTVTNPTCIKWSEHPWDIKKKAIVEKSGAYRARMTKNTAIAAEAIRFYGKGNIEKVNFYLSAIFGLGRGVNQGSGEIAGFTVQEVAKDSSWIGEVQGNQQLLRSLPIDVLENFLATEDFSGNIDMSDYCHELRNTLPPYHLSSSNKMCLSANKLIDNIH